MTINQLFIFTDDINEKFKLDSKELKSLISVNENSLPKILKKIELDLKFPNKSFEDLNRAHEMLSSNYMNDVLHNELSFYTESLSSELQQFEIDEYLLLLLRAKNFSKSNSKYHLNLYFKLEVEDFMIQKINEIIKNNTFLLDEGI